MIEIKVLVTDFDKTLYRNPKELKKNIELINKFMLNNMFILATGRAIYDIKPLINRYNIKYDYMLCNDGAIVYDKNNNLLLDIKIDDNVVNKVLEHIIKNKIENYYLDNGKKRNKNIYNNINAIIIRDKDKEISKQILNGILKLDNSINGYISDNWINITNKKVSKGNGLKFIIEKLNINKEDVYVIGDNINDLSMIKEFDGYAVNNAEEIVKNNSKGIFNGIKEFIDYISEV